MKTDNWRGRLRVENRAMPAYPKRGQRPKPPDLNQRKIISERLPALYLFLILYSFLDPDYRSLWLVIYIYLSLNLWAVTDFRFQVGIKTYLVSTPLSPLSQASCSQHTAIPGRTSFPTWQQNLMGSCKPSTMPPL